MDKNSLRIEVTGSYGQYATITPYGLSIECHSTGVSFNISSKQLDELIEARSWMKAEKPFGVEEANKRYGGRYEDNKA